MSVCCKGTVSYTHLDVYKRQDLGNAEALRYAVELISRYVQKLDLSCYRQDFNVDPLPYWDENEEG